MNLFAYGTLMDTEIMTQVSGATYRSQKATLLHYVRKTVRGEVYPAIIKQSRGSVEGIVYFDVSLESFDRLDTFEGPLYVRTEVETISNDGERVSTFTYVLTANSAHKLSEDDWNYENFIMNHKQLFQSGYHGYDELT
ncbi:MAG: gamma-glutamylcyclotransferase [Desulfocapsaceae bacterium]|nr:gamma-glutamylcyclotransferase [Desulfocapsaceae bacterium]